jgi:hypothetical protein
MQHLSITLPRCWQRKIWKRICFVPMVDNSNIPDFLSYGLTKRITSWIRSSGMNRLCNANRDTPACTHITSPLPRISSSVNVLVIFLGSPHWCSPQTRRRKRCCCCGCCGDYASANESLQRMVLTVLLLNPLAAAGRRPWRNLLCRLPIMHWSC